MRLLLDTHVFLWSQISTSRLGDVLDTLGDPGNELVVSAATAWEITIKSALGRLPLPEPASSWVPRRIADLGARAAGIEHHDALGVAALPPLHADPFDRLLIAQARRNGWTLVTADRRVWLYDVALLRVP